MAESIIDFVKGPLEAMKERVLHIANKAFEGRTDAEIKEAADMPYNQAPMWMRSAMNLATQVVRTDVDKAATVSNHLNIVMLERSESNAAWLTMAKAALKPPEEKPVIDVVPEKVPAEKKK